MRKKTEYAGWNRVALPQGCQSFELILYLFHARFHAPVFMIEAHSVPHVIGVMSCPDDSFGRKVSITCFITIGQKDLVDLAFLCSCEEFLCLFAPCRSSRLRNTVAVHVTQSSEARPGPIKWKRALVCSCEGNLSERSFQRLSVGGSCGTTLFRKVFLLQWRLYRHVVTKSPVVFLAAIHS